MKLKENECYVIDKIDKRIYYFQLFFYSLLESYNKDIARSEEKSPERKETSNFKWTIL